MLLDFTEAHKTTFGMKWTDRALLYRLAVETGLRASEIGSLKVSSFDFQDNSITVEAAYTKNRQEAVFELKADTALLLEQRFSSKLPHAAAFKLPVLTNISKMFKADMENTRMQWLKDAEKNPAELKAREKSDYLTTADNGRGKVDFHSLRHTFGSLLAASGVHPKTAQELMRHSDINLTMSRYSHTFRG